PVLEIRRHLPALERAFDLRHAGPAVETGDRTSRRNTLFFHRANGATAGGAPSLAAAAFRDRAGMRNPPRLEACLCCRHGPRRRRGYADRCQLPALRARELQPARRAADYPYIDPRREHTPRLVICVFQCAGTVRGRPHPSSDHTIVARNETGTNS